MLLVPEAEHDAHHHHQGLFARGLIVALRANPVSGGALAQRSCAVCCAAAPLRFAAG